MHRYDLIVFDWDGTLMDSTAHIAGCIQAACRDLSVDVPCDEDARYVIGLNMADLMRHIAPSLDAAGRAALAERYKHHFLTDEERIKLFDGVSELIADLSGRGHQLAVATGKSRRGLDRALDSTGLRPYFSATRCADEGFAKPHPGMLLALLDTTGVEASRAVMIGDTTHDLELAANAGVDAVAVLYGAHEPALLDTRPAKARCTSVAELHAWLTTP
ncbi:HAD-IA family hydrolase [Usitatibacter palustris]|uniref:5'-nucleotidase n=1 Tax=Usitatibacter palustris TaxID=2732487 RepID=A0A6M4H6F6_9PROT|nr:HAD-IA family hydrolase [Usitatibacter palustris]QJR15219.1 5'-nucleotidase [Usitatibacter palustris]